MATIIAAHDLSGVGRCSLTTALSVIPATGHSCYPLPTAVLSQQTAFPGYSFLDFTNHMPQYINGWRKLGVRPDMVYTGFLGGGAQTGLLSAFIEEHPGAKVLVDPVMGDAGRIYPCFSENFVKDMTRLAAHADILVPNATEFNLLAGRDPAAPLPDSSGKLLNAALEIDAPRLGCMIVTSAYFEGEHCNLLLDMTVRAVTPVYFKSNGVSYSGSGDLFASLICGFLASGQDIRGAVKTAGDFISLVADAMPESSDPRYGLVYEPYLARIAQENQKRA